MKSFPRSGKPFQKSNDKLSWLLIVWFSGSWSKALNTTDKKHSIFLTRCSQSFWLEVFQDVSKENFFTFLLIIFLGYFLEAFLTFVEKISKLWCRNFPRFYWEALQVSVEKLQLTSYTNFCWKAFQTSDEKLLLRGFPSFCWEAFQAFAEKLFRLLLKCFPCLDW